MVVVEDPPVGLVRVGADQPRREADRVLEAEHPVHLAAVEHLLAQVRRHVGDGDPRGVHAREAREGGEEPQRPIVRRAADRSPVQVGRRADRAVGADRDAESRAVVEHIHAQRALARTLRRQRHRGVDVAEPGLVGARRHLAHGRPRAVALVVLHLQPGLAEIAAILGQEEHPMRALPPPIQHHLHPGARLGERRGGQERAGGGQGETTRDEHARTPSWPFPATRRADGAAAARYVGRAGRVTRAPRGRRFFPGPSCRFQAARGKR